MKQTILGSITLATLLLTGCGGGSSDSVPAGTSTAVDITVERGKVYDANVTDSSTPPKVATQNSGQNVYRFAKIPTYPVIVNGGWIDVNDDGVMDTGDVNLDIEMKSYCTAVTTITTYIADANETLRNKKLDALLTRLNANGVGVDVKITTKDLLKVPSLAPRDVFVTANAIYKDIKENSGALPDEDAILSQFATIDTLGTNATAKDFEMQVVADLVTSGDVAAVSNKDIFEYEKELAKGTTQALQTALLKNNIKGLGILDNYTFDATYVMQGTPTLNWSVNAKTLTVQNQSDGSYIDMTFTTETPVDGDSYSVVGYIYDNDGKKVSIPVGGGGTVSITTTVITPESTTVATLPNPSSYAYIIIYLSIDPTGSLANSSSLGVDDLRFLIDETQTISCVDLGFTTLVSSYAGSSFSSSSASYINETGKQCSEDGYQTVSSKTGTSSVVYYIK